MFVIFTNIRLRPARKLILFILMRRQSVKNYAVEFASTNKFYIPNYEAPIVQIKVDEPTKVHACTFMRGYFGYVHVYAMVQIGTVTELQRVIRGPQILQSSYEILIRLSILSDLHNYNNLQR